MFSGIRMRSFRNWTQISSHSCMCPIMKGTTDLRRCWISGWSGSITTTTNWWNAYTTCLSSLTTTAKSTCRSRSFRMPCDWRNQCSLKGNLSFWRKNVCCRTSRRRKRIRSRKSLSSVCLIPESASRKRRENFTAARCGNGWKDTLLPNSRCLKKSMEGHCILKKHYLRKRMP